LEKYLAELRKIAVVARGPKPVAVLREWNVPIAIAAPEPNTWREMLRALDAGVPVGGRRVAVQEYGVANPELLDGLAATPEVAEGAHLLLLDDARDAALPSGVTVAWTKGVGLDSTIGGAGLAVIENPAPLLPLAERDPRIRLYRPISEKIREETR